MVAVVISVLVIFAPPLDTVKQAALALIEPDPVPNKELTLLETKAPKKIQARLPDAQSASITEVVEVESVLDKPVVDDSLETGSNSKIESSAADSLDTRSEEVIAKSTFENKSQDDSQAPPVKTQEVIQAVTLSKPESTISDDNRELASSRTTEIETTNSRSSILSQVTSETVEQQDETAQKENQQIIHQVPRIISEPSPEKAVVVETSSSLTESTPPVSKVVSGTPMMTSSQTEASIDEGKPRKIEQEIVRFTTHDRNNRPVEWDKIKFEGVDHNGKTVKMILLVLSESYFWRFGDLFITNDQGNSLKMRDHLATDPIRKSLENSKGMICVGTASEEGSLRLEEYRAALRADQLIDWMIDTQPGINSFYALGLGQYQKRPASHSLSDAAELSSEDQRRVILISITHQAPKANLTEALKNGLSQLKPLPFELQRFSTFDLKNRSSLI